MNQSEVEIWFEFKYYLDKMLHALATISYALFLLVRRGLEASSKKPVAMRYSKRLKLDYFCWLKKQMLIDTHAHIYLPKFDEDRQEVMNRAAAAGVQKIFLPNVDSTTITAMLKLERDYPERCFAMMGLHPCSVKENVEEELAIVKSWLDKRPFCAVGEIGIDLYWDKTFFQQQNDAFKKQIEWAIDLDIPIVIHSRESTDIVIEILTEMKNPKLRGIFHCFSGNAAQASAIVDLGFHLGIGGVLTYKKSTLPAAIKDIPLEWLVLETDAPYLPPVPFRGKRNESAYIHQIGDYLASTKQLPFEQIAAQTTKNALSLFDKPEK